MPFRDIAIKRAYHARYNREQRRLSRETDWDRKRYPDRRAWERAVLKCEQMRRKAIKHPHLMSRGMLKDWDFEWQYRLHAARGQQRQ
jgi:hypothetical protein